MNFNAMESGGYDKTALSEIDRSEMLTELARGREEGAHRQASAEVAANPELAAMLGRLIEGAGELSLQTAAHLRKIIALSYCFYGYNQVAIEAAEEQSFHRLVIDTVQEELDELNGLVGTERLPDMWDIAYRDLLRLEGNED